MKEANNYTICSKIKYADRLRSVTYHDICFISFKQQYVTIEKQWENLNRIAKFYFLTQCLSAEIKALAGRILTIARLSFNRARRIEDDINKD